MATETRQGLATFWQTEALDTGLIQDELNKLWNQLGGPPGGGQRPGEMIAEERYGGGLLMRANTLNLLAVADTQKDIRLIEETIRQLTDFQPSRTIILIARPPDEDRADDQPHFDVRVELLEKQTAKGEPIVRFEVVTIHSEAGGTGYLSSLVSPLLLAELPDFLWWPSGSFPRETLFEDLLHLVDRLIVDSAQLGRDAGGIGTLRALLDEEAAPKVGDFTWRRLAPWRQLIAQFFDSPDVQPCLNTIEQVSIAYADVRQDGSSGFPAALLTVGWLASRLGWEVIDPLERRRSGGWWAPLRARTGQRGREIELRLTPDTSPHAVFSLRNVRLVAGGEAPGNFQIERTDSDDLITSSESPSLPPVSRMVYARRPTNESMLGAELQRFGGDAIFEEALAVAARLLP